MAEGRHRRPWQKLGAHPHARDGRDGTAFAVWAPNAQAVAVVGDFNDWNPEAHPLFRRGDGGCWETWVPEAGPGQRYKFALLDAQGQRVFKTDPYARRCEPPPGHAAWITEALHATPAPRPGPPKGTLTLYEVHAGSWRRPGGVWPDWDRLACELVPHVAELGFSHLELLPVAEHPFYGSWGYQPTGLFAPTWRHGPPEALRRFVQAAHDAGLGVILDWVPAHFPADPHALARFDGTALYEHADPREGLHRDWNTLIYNFGRHEVRNFLIGNALYWIEQFGFDGLRVDAVASMLYRDYSRAPGEWVPNRHGGRENLEAIAFLRELNDTLHAEAPGVLCIAEESTAFPGVTAATAQGGLGFDRKWNMGWMNDTLAYLHEDPVHRRWHHHRLTFGLTYAWSERFVLPLSHDEVVHGKGSLLGKMPGDAWRRHAQLRALLAWQYALPGDKLLFMGAELACPTEWNHDTELPWGLLDQPLHAGTQALVRDLNHGLRHLPALHARDDEPQAFTWLQADAAEHSIYAFLRRGHDALDDLLVIANFTPEPRQDWWVGVPQAGRWRERLNTDSAHYGGANLGNGGAALAQPQARDGQPAMLRLTVPPLAVLWLQPDPAPTSDPADAPLDLDARPVPAPHPCPRP